MPQSQSTKLRIACSERSSSSEGIASYYSLGEALGKGLKVCAMSLIAGAVIVFVPLLHIFGVILLISAPFAGIFVTMKNRGALAGVQGSLQCPKCATISIMQFQSGKAPYYDSCSGCKNPLRIDLDA